MNDLSLLARQVFELIDQMQAGTVPWTRFDEIIAPGFRAYVPGAVVDADGFKKQMQTFGAAFSHGKHTVHDVVSDNNVAMVRETWEGMHTGTFLGAPATGKTVSSLVMVLLRFHDRKLTEFHETFDTLALMRDTGVIA